ncbi:chloramphenicol phosphotransferase CPT [Streptomyces sp. NPDC058664]|uniref:chloramphenicol phosphotransferase CPT n=1 Tax=unclassified Streptomyces TaxID=2593676 RepID=UPI00364F2231
MIILNGASSSGKSGIVRCLQSVLPDPWLTFGCDSFVDALPARMRDSDGGIVFDADGGVSIGDDFRALEAAWAQGVVTMARAGARIIIDDVFLGGAASQSRWRDALGDLPVLWVGVHCDPTAAAGREIARGDRTPGMAAQQAQIVHEGVEYDLTVDTTRTESLDCARAIAARLG